MRTSSRIALLFVLLLHATFVACGGKTHPPGDVPSNGAVLELGEATLGLGVTKLSLHASGAVEANGKPLGTLSADGRLVSPSGTLIGSLDADGRILNAEGKPMRLWADVRVLPDGALKTADGEVSVPDEGTFNAPNGRSLTIKVEKRSVRRAAVFAVLMMLPAVVERAKEAVGAANAQAQAMGAEQTALQGRLKANAPVIDGPCSFEDQTKADWWAACSPDGKTRVGCTKQGVWRRFGVCVDGCDPPSDHSPGGDCHGWKPD